MLRFFAGVLLFASLSPAASAQSTPCPPGQTDDGAGGCTGGPPPQGPSPAPQFAISFTPTDIFVDDASVLTFTIDNTGGVTATDLAFSDDLPDGLEVAAPSNASTTCIGGTLTAAPGSATIEYSGGSVAAQTSCAVTVDVTATEPGEFVNTTSELSSSFDDSPAATATLSATFDTIDVSFSAAQRVVSEGDGQIVFTLVLSNAPDREASVTLSLVSGDPADLGGFESTTVVLDARTETVRVPITDDGRREDRETFIFSLEVAEGDEDVLSIGSPGSTAILIADNDADADVVQIPRRDTDGDGIEDGGPRFLSLPVGGLTVGEVAETTGADSVFWFRDGAEPTVAPSAAVLQAGEPLLLTVAPGSDLSLSGTLAFTQPITRDGREVADGERVIVPFGNPTTYPIRLGAITVEGGTLADVALVFDAAAGSFRPVSLSGLGSALLAPYQGVVFQVVPDGSGAPVTMTVPVDGSAAGGGTVLNGAPFSARDDETAVVVRLSSNGDAAGGDELAVRFLPEGENGLDPFDAVDVVSPFGATLASDGAGEGLLAAISSAPLERGESATVPLVLGGLDAGTYNLSVGLPAGALTVEVLDRGVATVLADGQAFSFTVSEAEATDSTALAGRFALRVTDQGSVSAEDEPAPVRVTVFPNPSPGVATVSVEGVVSETRVALYDALGRRAVVLHDGPTSGRLILRLDDHRLAPGVYVLLIEGEALSESRPVTIVR